MVTSQGARSKEPHATLVDGYRLGQTIGKGSYASVKAAKCTTSRRKVAIKIVPRSNVDDKLEAEISNHSKLHHKHIVEIIDVVRKDHATCIVMELASAGSLYDYIVCSPQLTEEKARRTFQQLIAALDHCHAHNIVHRDLKPENILMDHDGNVKLADFGFSAKIGEGELLSESCGSPNYVAPELLKKKRSYRFEVDIWSCGVILYALLCRQLPFDEPNIPDLFRRIQNADYIVPGFMSDDAKDLVGKMMTVDPNERITIAEIKTHPWFVQGPACEMAIERRVATCKQTARSQQALPQPDDAKIRLVTPPESILSKKVSKIISFASLLSVAGLLLSRASDSHEHGSQLRFPFLACFLPFFTGLGSFNF
mmetsp:Transcript_29235/g.46608  ORF Transcript_29235/g.46608 Transcript_29235/m.46608 type:complete len:367 (-) Transcript_29235:399-1499(-)